MPGTCWLLSSLSESLAFFFFRRPESSTCMLLLMLGLWWDTVSKLINQERL